MDEIRVGDVSVKGSQIRIGGNDPLSAMSGVRVSPPPEVGLAFLQWIPLSTPTYLVLGTAIALFGVGAVLVHGGFPESALEFLRDGAILIPVGIGTVVLGVMRHYGLPIRGTPAPDPSTREAVAAVSALIARSHSFQTVDWIRAQLGWSEGDVVRALGWLRRRGELVEDVDVETGDYYYAFLKAPRDLTSRIRDDA